MERKTTEIILVSGACCSPSLTAVEKALEKQLRQTVEELTLDAGVRVVSLSAVLASKGDVTAEQSRLLQALFQKYGLRFAPAGLAGTRVLFAGNSPTPDKLKEILQTL